MTTYETPRDADGNPLCQFCQRRPVPKSLGTKPRMYCGRSCKQRAYEARKVREAIVAAVAAAVARDRKSRAQVRNGARDFAPPPVTRAAGRTRRTLAAPDVVPDEPYRLLAEEQQRARTARRTGRGYGPGLPMPLPLDAVVQPDPPLRPWPHEDRPDGGPDSGTG